MIVAIHQPEHIPWLQYFEKMKLADHFIFLDDVQYRKSYFQNRNQIINENGDVFFATIALNKSRNENPNPEFAPVINIF